MPKEKKLKSKVEETEVEEVEEDETEEEETEVEETEVEAVPKKAVKAAVKAGVPKREAVRLVEETPSPDPDDRESILAYLKKIEKKVDRFLVQKEPVNPAKEKLNGKDEPEPVPQTKKERSFWDLYWE